MNATLYGIVGLFFMVPFIITFFIMPNTLGKLRKHGHLARDMYKRMPREIPYDGGLIILMIPMVSLSILSLFFMKTFPLANYAVMATIVMFGLFGLLDDNIDISRPAKLLFLYYLTFPIIPLLSTTNILFPLIGPIDLGIFYLQIIAPLYIAVTSNLINMHSGFNGLAPGTTLIILITLILKSIIFGEVYSVLFIICLAGALSGYVLYEYYPARIFWGNIGALSCGATVGVLIVMEGFIVSGIVMLIPHIVNFLMFVYWRLFAKNKYPFIKFGREREDGTVEVPNPLTLKWVLPYYFRLTEKQSTNAMLLLTAVFCVIGFCVPG